MIRPADHRHVSGAVPVPAVEAERLTFRYRSGEKPVFRDVSFSVKQRETVLFLGPSGCGKSTLMYCLNRLYPDSVDGILEGTVKVYGQPVSDVPAGELCRKIGIVFQDPDSQFCMTRVDEEVAFGLENLGVPRSEMDERIDRILRQVGLAEYRRERIHTLSGGMKQKLAVACVLAAEPKILILDEPTAQLDPQSAREIVHHIIKFQQERGLTLLIVEHRLDEWIAHVDRCLLLHADGGLLDEGAPRACFTRHGKDLAHWGIWMPAVTQLTLELPSSPDAVQEELPVTERQFIEAVKGAESVTADLERRLQPPRPAEQPHDPESVLSVDGLTVRIGNKTVLRRIDLAFRLGELAAIVGANGSGKTTLLQHLGGIGHKSSEGDWRLNGRPPSDWSQDELRRRIGYVFQNPEHQFVTFTVFDEVAFGMRQQRLPESAVHAEVRRLLQESGLAGLEEANPFSLSQGQKRRLSVATMLADEQQWLLLDEPTFGQDARTSEQLMLLLRRRVEGGKAVIMVTHDMELVQRYADRVILLMDGEVRYDGAPFGLWKQEDLLSQSGIIPPVCYRLRMMLEQQHVGENADAAFRTVESGS
jgi:energy-coupling factor transport system ATP-binding protein